MYNSDTRRFAVVCALPYRTAKLFNDFTFLCGFRCRPQKHLYRSGTAAFSAFFRSFYSLYPVFELSLVCHQFCTVEMKVKTIFY